MDEQQNEVPSSISIFYSYAPEDESLRKELEKHLSSLRRQELISSWYNRLIVPGTDWAETIDIRLSTASVILLLISPDFLASDYLYGMEMTRALERQKAGVAHVIPVILRPVDWQGTPFANLHPLPPDAKAVTTWPNRDAAFREVARGIRRAVEHLHPYPGTTHHSGGSKVDAWRSFVPTTTKPTHGSNLPHRFANFVGRDADVKQVFEALASRAWIVTIDGMGGIGKTTLALEVAHRCRQQDTDKIAMPNFTGYIWTSARDKPGFGLADVVREINQTIAPHEVSKLKTADFLGLSKRILSAEPRLLIIDNFETVQDEDLHRFLRDELPDPSKVLITSRHHIQTGEKVINLSGLSMPDAVRLLRLEAQRWSIHIRTEDESKLEMVAEKSFGIPFVLKWVLESVYNGKSLEWVLETLENATADDVFSYIFTRSLSALDQQTIYLFSVMAVFQTPVRIQDIRVLVPEMVALRERIGKLVRCSLLEDNRRLVEGEKQYALHPFTRYLAEHMLKQVPEVQNQLQDRLVMYEARLRYLELIYERYSSITLPIDPARSFSLQAIFQPLKLRRDPLIAEDLIPKDRRPLIGEFTSSEGDSYSTFLDPSVQRFHNQMPQTVLAENGEDALKKSPKGHMVVLGGPGTGKTTLLRYLICAYTQKALGDLTASLPIFISLPHFALSGKTLKEYLVVIVQNMVVDERYADVLWKAVENGQTFICLDGLDEVVPPKRVEIIRLISELAAKPGNFWVVGSRFIDYKGGQFYRGQFAEWELQPMDYELRQFLAQRLLPELYHATSREKEPSEEAPSTFVKLLEAHPQIAAWSENTLLFILAAIVFVRTGALPYSPATLYQYAIDAILEMHEADMVRRSILRQILTTLALELHRTRMRTFTSNDMLDLLPDIRREQKEIWGTDTMLSTIITSGILEVVAYQTYGFQHQGFQEYFAAAGLAQRLVHRDQKQCDDTWAFIWSKRTYNRWTEVLRLMIGVLVEKYGKQGTHMAVRWIKALTIQRKQPEGDVGNLGLVLALKSLNETMSIKSSFWHEAGGRELESEIITAWIDELLHAARHKARWKRLEALVFEIVHLSIQAIREAVEQLVAILEKEDSDMVERQAVRVILKYLKGQAALGGDICQIIVKALDRLGEQPYTEVFLDTGEDSEEQIREIAVDLLQRSHPEVLSTITSGVLITLLRQEATAPAVVHSILLEQLSDLLDSPYWQIQVAVAQALGKLRRNIPEATIKRLYDLRLHSPSRKVREVIDDALSEILSLEAGIEDD